jgi:hypothetical protein
MAKLKRYSDSYDKTGYYVHAPISDADHPIPLQTPDITERIYDELGYSPGDRLPDKLVWSLNDVGLHWTENQEAAGNQDAGIPDLEDGESPELTDEEVETVMRVLDQQSRSHEEEISELKELLNVESEAEDVTNFDDDTERLIEKYEPEGVKDDEEVEKLRRERDEEPHPFGPPRAKRSKHLERMSKVPDLKQILVEYENHEWEVDHIRAKSLDEYDKAALSVELQHPDIRITCIDYRPIQTEEDFTIKFPSGLYTHNITISEGCITDVDVFANLPGFEIEKLPEEHWFYEVEQTPRDEIKHTVIKHRAEFVMLALEFIESLTEYKLRSTEYGDKDIRLAAEAFQNV